MPYIQQLFIKNFFIPASPLQLTTIKAVDGQRKERAPTKVYFFVAENYKTNI